MKKRFALLLAVIFTVTGIGMSFSASSAYAATLPPAIEGEAAILIDGNTGKILYTKNEHSQLPPASTTKMITCLLALENLDLNAICPIDAEVAHVLGSKVFLLENESLTVEQVLYCLMLPSANDAALAIARAVAGDDASFAAMMNTRAKELGAINTNFITPNGLHEDAHLSTAYDLAMIAKGCMENPEFRKLCSTYKYHIPATNMQDERYLYNTNRLLYDTVTHVTVDGQRVPCIYEGAIGIKTGTTTEAGGCLVAAAERDGTYLIGVVLNSGDDARYADMISLLNYGYANYYGVEVANAETADMGLARVKRGAVRDVQVVLEENAYVTLPIEASKNVITSELVLNEEIKAPIVTGQAIGVYNVYEGGNLVTTVAAIAAEAVDEGTFLSVFGIEDKTAHVIFWVAGILFALIFILTVTYIVLKRRQIKRRKARREARAMEIAKQRAEREKDINKRDWRF